MPQVKAKQKSSGEDENKAAAGRQFLLPGALVCVRLSSLCAARHSRFEGYSNGERATGGETSRSR